MRSELHRWVKIVTKRVPMEDECLPGGLKGQPDQLQSTKIEIDL